MLFFQLLEIVLFPAMIVQSAQPKATKLKSSAPSYSIEYTDFLSIEYTDFLFSSLTSHVINLHSSKYINHSVMTVSQFSNQTFRSC